MNFREQFKKGKEGKNIGLPTGLTELNRAIDGIQKKSIYAIGAAPKVGKTTFVDQAFVIEPFLHLQNLKVKEPENPIKVNWIYYSFEIDRVKKEFKYAAHFMFRDFGISNFTHNGKIYQMSPRYLLGRLTDENDKVITVTPEHEEMLKQIYLNRIIPMFGEYNAAGKKIRKGAIDFIADRDNPTGLRNHLIHYAKQNGEFIYEKYLTRNEKGQEVQKERITGYKPNDPNLFTIIITDHMRKLKRERNYTTKENIDKWIEYQVELRNWCDFIFVDIIHLNRALASIDRLKYMKDQLYPTGDDFKDTGNLSEEADYILTLFNPNDEKYKLENHFGIVLANYPNYRSVHLVESRDTESPQHLAMQMYGNINLFKSIS